jgi:hypothetical protein
MFNYSKKDSPPIILTRLFCFGLILPNNETFLNHTVDFMKVIKFNVAVF